MHWGWEEKKELVKMMIGHVSDAGAGLGVEEGPGRGDRGSEREAGAGLVGDDGAGSR
jgi:hypothetical protein